MPDTGTITTHESGGDFVVEWQIPRFSTLPEADGAWCESPYFFFGGEWWYFRILPNGASQRGISSHLDLCLWKYPSGRSITQSFSLSLKTAKGERHKEEHVTKDFQNFYPESCHDLLRFISRAELTRLRSELLPDDVLTVVCTLKKSTSAESDSNPASAAISTPASNFAGCSSDSGECRHCSGNFAAGILSSHQRRCEQRPMKCPDCLEVVVLQKLLNEHECHLERTQAGTKHKENSENTSVDASTQTEEDSVPSLSENYKRMLLDGRDHNLILKVGDKELRAHRDVLRVRSRVFESMLDHDMKEKNTGVIDVSDCDPDAMELFLSYVYCGKIEALDQGNMIGLYYIADKYEMMELKSECSEFIKKSLSVNNICSVIQLSLNHSDSELLEYATGYFANNMLDIMQTVEWQSFLKENSTVANELLIKSIELKNARS